MCMYSCKAISVLTGVVATLQFLSSGVRIAVITHIIIMYSLLDDLLFKSSLCFVSKLCYMTSTVGEDLLGHGARVQG